MMSIIVSLRTIFNKEIFSKFDPNIKGDYLFNDYISEEGKYIITYEKDKEGPYYSDIYSI